MQLYLHFLATPEMKMVWLIPVALTLLMAAVNSQTVFSCQEVSTWLNGVPHQGVRLSTPRGHRDVVVHLLLDGVALWNWDSNKWEIDEPAVDAWNGLTVDKILQNVEVGEYSLFSNNCIHYKNRVLKYCEP